MSTLTEKTKSRFVGPIFISIGNVDQLQIFREKFLSLTDQQLFVDDSDNSESYQSIGLKKLFENLERTKKGSEGMMKNLKMSKELMNDYLESVKSVSPEFNLFKLGQSISKVSQLGGTIGIRDNQIVYVYEDGVPGDYPNPIEVLNQIKITSEETSMTNESKTNTN